nr:sensor histidine kinase [Niabella hibiscisoli]
MAALKSQLNPHFLFNTLNNIYSLSITNSPSTSEAIAGLSAMLDHVLYRSHDRFVPLQQEINFIRNYVSLEELRYGEELDVKLVADDITTGAVAPLILPSLVENAFKHVGVNSQNQQFVKIKLSRQQQQLKFLVVNTYAAHEHGDNENGIGLKNIRQQLSLIYQQNYNFQTVKQEGIFVAQLEIDII